jgi:hypothetical protein
MNVIMEGVTPVWRKLKRNNLEYLPGDSYQAMAYSTSLLRVPGDKKRAPIAIQNCW